jgi:putative membrane-bound dehydrogenase-like protein
MKLGNKFLAAVLWVLAPSIVCFAAEPFRVHSFQKTQLSDQFFCEGATFFDVNKDGAMDVVSGPYWYAGPKFTDRHEIYAPRPVDIAGYSKNFFGFSHDVDNDDWTDLIVLGFPGEESWWFRNPQNKPGHWARHVAFAVTDNESPEIVDITGDGKPELVCSTGGVLGYAEIPTDDPTKLWPFHGISPKKDYQRFTHGMGVGDVNNDGRLDVLEKNGWYEQPAQASKDKVWTFHAVPFSQGGGAQMLVFDVDGDGDNDVVTSKAAHAYGLSWFENVGGDNGSIAFKEHSIMGEKPEENEYGVVFSQLHALALADMDHDNVPDIVTGKRYWAHADKDPGSLEPAVLYWFKTDRRKDGVHFVPFQIDNNSGIGTQVVAGDINGDKWADVVVGNKKGTFILTHQVKEVDRRVWEGSQPTPIKLGGPQTSTAPLPGNSKDGYAATAADGRVLNLDFEKGDLSDWTATGSAFEGQPIKGDSVHPRRADSVSGHRGQFWIGTYEPTERDGPQGTLTSVPFRVTHPYARFLVGGGAGRALQVQIVRADNNEVVFSASGRSAEEMRPAVADLKNVVGKDIYLKIIDLASAGWGHINYDDFRFFDERPAGEEPQKSDSRQDDYPYAGLPADEAARAMKLPEGFSVTVCAAEPDVKQPIAMALDDRGRLWVAEGYNYPVRAPEGQGQDRILIFEDSDGDGHFDKRKVFSEKLNLVSGLELGFGGVYVGAAPYLLFIPDRNSDDVPDGKPEILLDGWAYEDTHETLNTFIWGPDGWLYGCHGVFTHSRVGKPGTPDTKRIPINAGIWRYHPTRHEFEIFAEGTSNPWGVDFDDHGQAFCTACVIPHLYHVIPGARYQRQAGNHFEPYTYADIQTIADHRHYVGDTPHGGNGRSNDAGGGHAHCGAMIYLGGAWPDEYRGRIFMNNIHGQRINTDILAPKGSGFVGHHGPDFLLSGDLASQILNLRYGPDGNAYVIDWYDTNACHHNNIEGHDRTNGRIYKVSYGKSSHNPVDLKKHSDKQLVELVLEKNDWYVRHARRILQERAAAGKIDPAARERLKDIALKHDDPTRRLRALWALHVTGQLPSGVASATSDDRDPNVRAWGVRLISDSSGEIAAQSQMSLVGGAKSDPSPLVRLAIASAIQRLPADDEARWRAVESLTRHAEDAGDHNLPLMYWYAAEPLAEADPERALQLGLSCGKTIPLVRDFMLRRVASLDSHRGLPMLIGALGRSSEPAEQLTILRAVRASLTGQRRVKQPAGWADVYRTLAKSNDEQLKSEAGALGVTFGDRSAMEALRAIVTSKIDDAQRRSALQALLDAKDATLVKTLQTLLADPALRAEALRGLALYDDPATPAKVLAAYSALPAPEKRSALATLASRAPYGVALFKAVADNQIPTSDLSADLIRQLHNLKDATIDEQVATLWGRVRATADDKAKLIASYRELINNTPQAQADPTLGRAVYAKTCQQCHVLYGTGANIGPDLTGSNRADLDYLLTNMVDPSALIAKEYQASVIVTVDGRIITGIVSNEDDKSITIRTATETVVLPKDEIDERTLSETSMMPDDQLKQFSPPEVASLVAYLRGKTQVPMLATNDNATLLFNGQDLKGWTGDTQIWSVENGEIVGRSPQGLSHNTFLLSDLSAENFRLSFEVKLANDVGNSGVQFRSEPINGFEEVRGYQADIGPTWWGKLYEENGRALLWDRLGDQHVKKGDWNQYEVEAIDGHIKTWINGQPCVDLEDGAGATRGIFALQVHSGEPTEVRFRNLKLEVR